MSGGIKVADLYGAFRIDVDARSTALVDSVLGKVKTTLLAVASIAGAVKFVRMVGGIADLGDKLDEMSQKTGATVESIQEFGAAAEESGVGLDSVAMTLGKLSINMDKAGRGGKGAADAFHRMGIKVKGADGKLRPALDVIDDMADRFQKMPDGAEKASLAVAVLGRSGRELIPVLNQGSAKLRELGEEFRASGAEISGKDAAAFGEYNDQVGRLHHQWQGVKVQIALGLLPTLRKLVAGLSAWFKANRAVIRQRVEQFVAGLVVVFRGLALALGAVAKILGFMMDNWQATLAAIASVTAAAMLLGEVSVMAAARAVAAWVAAALPLILLGALILGVILVVQDLYSWFIGGDSVLKDWLKVGIEAMHERLMGAIRDVRAEFQAFLDWLSGESPISTGVTAKVGGTTAGQAAAVARRRGHAGPTVEQYRVPVSQGFGDLGNEDLGWDRQAYSIGQTGSRGYMVNQSAHVNVVVHARQDKSIKEDAEYFAAKIKETVHEEFGTLLRQTADATGGE